MNTKPKGHILFPFSVDGMLIKSVLPRTMKTPTAMLLDI